MPDGVRFKLGKRAAKVDKRTLKLAKYFTTALLPPPPSTDWTSGIKNWGLMLNDQLGDCTIAAVGHAVQVWSAARGGLYTLPDSAILQKYEQWCGYDPNDSSTDQGGVELDVLTDWRKSGIWNHKLIGFADPDPKNLGNVMQAIHLFGGVYIGVQLPVHVRNKPMWDVSKGPNAIPGSWGGHAVFVPRYRVENSKLIFTAISWGRLYDITQDFWLYNDPANGPYIDEVHALVAPEFVSLKTGVTPSGLNLTQMMADVQLVTA
jgi:hypothetical protein